MSKKVQCAIVGAGWWGTTAHLPALLRHPKADVCCVHHRDTAIAQKIATDFEIPRCASTLDEVLAIDDLDAAVVSSAAAGHYHQAKECLLRGLHVLIEKPMTIRVDEARELVQLAEKQGVQFLISAPFHCTAHAAEARRIIQSGELGEIKMISVLYTNFTEGVLRGLLWDELFPEGTFERTHPPYIKPEPETHSDPANAGGGQIYNQISHVAACLAFLTGQDPVEVFARLENFDTKVDVYDTLNVKLNAGTLVSIASTGVTFSDRTFENRIYGTEGMLFLEQWQGKLAYHPRRGEWKHYPALAEDDIYPMYAPTENFIDAVVGDAPNHSPARLGLSAMKMIEAACQSAATGRNVVVE